MGKFNVTLNWFCSRPIGTLVNSMWGNPDVRATGNSAQQCEGKIPTSSPPQKCPSPWWIWTPSNTQFLGPSESTSQTAFQSVWPFLKGSRSLQTHRLTDRPHNSNRPHLTSAAISPNNNNNWSKNFDGRLQCRGDFSSGKFNATFDCFCGRPIGTLVDSMLGIPVLL